MYEKCGAYCWQECHVRNTDAGVRLWDVCGWLGWWCETAGGSRGPHTRVVADPGRRARGAVRVPRGLRLPSSTLPRFEVFDVLRPARASHRSALRTRRCGIGAPPLPAFHSEMPRETKYSPNVMLSTLTRDADGIPHHYYKLTHAKDRWIISDPIQATQRRPRGVLASLGDALGRPEEISGAS